MEWKQEYEIGIPDIDNQHKKLFTLVNNLKSSMVIKKGSEEILSIALPKIVNYTIEHFEYEEQIMKELKFPGIKIQQRQHQSLISEIKGILYQMKDGRKYNPIQLYNMLCQWLLKHFINEDQKLKEFVANNK